MSGPAISAAALGKPGGSRAFSADGPRQAPVAPRRSCEAKYMRAEAQIYGIMAHLSVNKDAPSPRTVHSVVRILPTPFLGGLIICMCEFDFRQAHVFVQL